MNSRSIPVFGFLYPIMHPWYRPLCTLFKLWHPSFHLTEPPGLQPHKPTLTVQPSSMLILSINILPMNSTPLSLLSRWNDIKKLKVACHLYAFQTSFEFSTKYCDAHCYAITWKWKSIQDPNPRPWWLNAYISTQSVSYVITHVDEQEVHICNGLFDGKHH